VVLGSTQKDTKTWNSHQPKFCYKLRFRSENPATQRFDPLCP